MTYSIEKERLTAHGENGILMGTVNFPRIRAGLVNISQVTVLSQFRGQGVEAGMMDALLDHLTRSNQKAALTSPYAQKYVENNTRWKHILPEKIHFTSH